MRGNEVNGRESVVILASWEKQSIRICKNISLYPRILYPIQQDEPFEATKLCTKKIARIKKRENT